MPKEAKAGEVWLVDLGLAAKMRPCLIISDPPTDEELALQVVIPHTTATRGNRWEHPISAPFLRGEGVLHIQQIRAIPIAKLERRLGLITDPILTGVRRRMVELLRLDE